MTIACSAAAAMPSAWDDTNAVRRIALALVWLAVASGAVVFSEPAPVDLLSIGLIAALPLVGLVTLSTPLWAALAVWLVCATGAFVAAGQAVDFDRASIHSGISVYLYAMFFVMAGFVAKRPYAHTRLILDAYLWAAFVGAMAGVIGYFGLLPGAAEMFTKYGRASGTFKDPNVYGPFLVPALLYALHRLLNAAPSRSAVALAFQTVLPAVMLVFLSFGVLLSFSRGAWFSAAVALSIYAYFSMVFAPSNRQRIKMLLLGSLALVMAAGALVFAAQFDRVGELLAERAALTQDYDQGPEGRFGGQAKARQIILDAPLGIGALEFGVRHHHEDVHNVYLSMFLNAGWLGGLAFAAVVLVTAVLGLHHALRVRATHGLFLIAYGAFLGNALEGFIVDIDHWRHFYLLMAIVWGLMAAERAPLRAAGLHAAEPVRPLRRVRIVAAAPA